MLDACRSATHRAALRLTGVALGGDIDARLLRDLAAADPVALAAIANTGHVHTLLHAACGRDPRLDAALPDDLWLYLDEMGRANAARAAAGRHELASLGAACMDEGTGAIVLKGGAAFVGADQTQADRRFVSDLDLLLPEDMGDRLHDRLVTDGAQFTPFPDPMASGMHHVPALILPGHVFPVEIHVRPGQWLVQQGLDADEIARCAEGTALPGIAVPCEAHRYVHHVLHSAYDRHHDLQVYLRSLQDHQFYRETMPMAVAEGQQRLAQASLARHGQVLSALTDVALGKEDTVAMRAQAKWLRRALRDFGHPRRRQLATVTNKLRRMVRQLFASAEYRHHLVTLARDRDAIRASLWRHCDDMNRQK